MEETKPLLMTINVARKSNGIEFKEVNWDLVEGKPVFLVEYLSGGERSSNRYSNIDETKEAFFKIKL